MDNIVPILTEGLIEVCKLLPDQPVDHLSDYLMKRSYEISSAAEPKEAPKEK